MPSTHFRLVYHLVFSTKDRRPLILQESRTRLHEYLGGIVRSLGGVALRVNGTAEHVHLVVSLRPTHRVSDVMREIKHESSAWVRTTLRPAMFGWQDGYGAFTVAPSDLDRILTYVEHREEHHRTTTFQEEYVALLTEQGVEFDHRYLW